jgi:hypothetical protein
MGLRVSKLNLHESENLPSPLFAKEGYKTSLWQREVRRDFINNVFTIEALAKVLKPTNLSFRVKGEIFYTQWVTRFLTFIRNDNLRLLQEPLL